MENHKNQFFSSGNLIFRYAGSPPATPRTSPAAAPTLSGSPNAKATEADKTMSMTEAGSHFKEKLKEVKEVTYERFDIDYDIGSKDFKKSAARTEITKDIFKKFKDMAYSQAGITKAQIKKLTIKAKSEITKKVKEINEREAAKQKFCKSMKPTGDKYKEAMVKHVESLLGTVYDKANMERNDGDKGWESWIKKVAHHYYIHWAANNVNTIKSLKHKGIKALESTHGFASDGSLTRGALRKGLYATSGDIRRVAEMWSSSDESKDREVFKNSDWDKDDVKVVVPNYPNGTQTIKLPTLPNFGRVDDKGKAIQRRLLPDVTNEEITALNEEVPAGLVKLRKLKAEHKKLGGHAKDFEDDAAGLLKVAKMAGFTTYPVARAMTDYMPALTTRQYLPLMRFETKMFSKAIEKRKEYKKQLDSTAKAQWTAAASAGVTTADRIGWGVKWNGANGNYDNFPASKSAFKKLPKDNVAAWVKNSQGRAISACTADLNLSLATIGYAIENRGKFKKLHSQRIALWQKLSAQYTNEDLKVMKDSTGKSYYKKIEAARMEFGIKGTDVVGQKNWTAEAAKHGADRHVSIMTGEIAVVKELLKQAPSGTLKKPVVTLTASGLSFKAKETLKPAVKALLQTRLKKALTTAVKYTGAAKLNYSKLVKMAVSKAAGGGIKIIDPQLKIKGKPTETTVSGYASFDSSGDDFADNLKQFALARAKRKAGPGMKTKGFVMCVGPGGKLIKVSDTTPNPKAKVKASWKNLLPVYNKMDSSVTTVAQLKKVVSDFNKGKMPAKPKAKALLNKYIKAQRKVEVQVAPATSFNISVTGKPAAGASIPVG